jgi:3-dehydroquinate dehydratase-2
MKRKVKIMILDGPNLANLGKREPEIYGNLSRTGIEKNLRSSFESENVELEFHQSDFEGELIGWIEKVSTSMDALVINPGALTHFHYALRDAIAACTKPVIEVHMTMIFSREGWRKNSVTAPVCNGFVAGFGWRSYYVAISEVLNFLEEKERGTGH